MIRDFESLENWELRIIEAIKNDPNLELAVLMRDGTNTDDLKKRKLTFSQKLSQYIWKKQQRIEEGRYLKNKDTVNKQDMVSYLNTFPVLKLNPKSESNANHFNADDIGEVRKYNLDVILKHQFNAIAGDMVYAAKQGIWYMTHSDNSIQKGGFQGFWEVINRDPVISSSLFKINLNGHGELIDQAHFNINATSACVTNFIAKESSVSLLMKYLSNIKINNFQTTGEETNFKFLDKKVDIIYTFKYIINFNLNHITRRIIKVTEFFVKKSHDWKVYIGKGYFHDFDWKSVKPLKIPKYEFWADPFLFKYKSQTFVFFERYSIEETKGKISCCRLENNNVVDVCDVLELPYHLSYPFIFEENGEVYMMPETSKNKRLEIYRCISFPNQWEIYSTAFEGEEIVDAFFYTDEYYNKWLFLNNIPSQNVDRSSELHIYKVDSISLNEIIPHKKNPIFIDSRVARNGGAIFQYGKDIFRPSQRNTDGIYGKGLNINRIITLNIEDYKEETIKIVDSNLPFGFNSIHHLHQTDFGFVFDAC